MSVSYTETAAEQESRGVRKVKAKILKRGILANEWS